jgi:hypothetical protein
MSLTSYRAAPPRGNRLFWPRIIPGPDPGTGGVVRHPRAGSHNGYEPDALPGGSPRGGWWPAPPLEVRLAGSIERQRQSLRFVIPAPAPAGAGAARGAGGISTAAPPAVMVCAAGPGVRLGGLASLAATCSSTS